MLTSSRGSSPQTQRGQSPSAWRYEGSPCPLKAEAGASCFPASAQAVWAGHDESAARPQAGLFGVQVVPAARIPRVIAGIEGEIGLAPVGGDGGNGVFDEVRRARPFRDADGCIEQAYGPEQGEQPFVPEPARAGNGHVRARRKKSGEGDGPERRHPVAHVRAHADNVAFTAFASRVLHIDAIAEVSRLSPGEHHIAGQIKATDDGFFLVENIHISS